MNDVVEHRGQKWVALLDRGMEKIGEALPEHIDQKKFRQVAATAIGNTTDLKRCLENNPGAVLGALSQCAADGLLPNNREAALVPFKDSLTYIPMIAGVLKRMRQSGDITSVSARIVYENDEFEVVYGDDEHIQHKPAQGPQGKPVGAYAIIRLSDGEVYREFMSAEEIGKVKKAAKSQNGPWSGPFETEMWRKTVLKRAAKYCPFSSDDIPRLLDQDNDYYDPDKVIDVKPVRTPAAERFAALRRETPSEDEEPPKQVDLDDEIPPFDSSPPQEEVEQASESASPPSSPSPERKRKDSDADRPTTDVVKEFARVKTAMADAKTREGATAVYEGFQKSEHWAGVTDPMSEELFDVLMSKDA